MKIRLNYKGFPGFKLSKLRLNQDTYENSRKSIHIPNPDAETNFATIDHNDELYLKYLAYRRDIQGSPTKSPTEDEVPKPSYPEYVMQSEDV